MQVFIKMSGRSYNDPIWERSARLNAMGITLAKQMPRPPALKKEPRDREYVTGTIPVTL